ncbi:MAG: hypothetical protein WC682_00800 [Parcubacteria group bacterium]|jgi:hypothetical protein
MSNVASVIIAIGKSLNSKLARIKIIRDMIIKKIDKRLEDLSRKDFVNLKFRVEK